MSIIKNSKTNDEKKQTIKLLWATDIHLDHLSPEQGASFIKEMAGQKPSVAVITGDISTAETVDKWLLYMDRVFTCPVYFVLGNHDYYHGSIEQVRQKVRQITRYSQRVRWLPEVGLVSLTPNTVLIGCDGWGDARLGDFDRSDTKMSDYIFIKELIGLDRPQIKQVIQSLGKDSANYIARALPEAMNRAQFIIIATHVPPFAEACWHQGRRGDAKWLPNYTCGAIGEVIQEMSINSMYHQFLVLCGHTHGYADVHILPNLHIKVGEVEYGKPIVQDIITVY